MFNDLLCLVPIYQIEDTAKQNNYKMWNQIFEFIIRAKNDGCEPSKSVIN